MLRMQHGGTRASVACDGIMLSVAVFSPKQTHMELVAAGFIRVCDISLVLGKHVIIVMIGIVSIPSAIHLLAAWACLLRACTCTTSAI